MWNNFAGNSDNPKLSGVVKDEDTDEELDEKYANIDVNFDESETEEEDEYVPRSLGHYDHKKSLIIDEDIDDFLEEDLDSVVPSFEEYEDIPISRGKSFIQDDLFEEPGIVNKSYYSEAQPQLSDIDLEDPAVKAAATKIQSVFKGFKARKKVFNQTGYKCG